MSLTSMVKASVLATGIAAAGLAGVGLGSAAAAPGQPCGAPGAPVCQGAPAPNNGWQNRNVDQARRDHQPFNYNGQHVQPLPAGNGDGWGFWFLGRWIKL